MWARRRGLRSHTVHSASRTLLQYLRLFDMSDVLLRRLLAATVPLRQVQLRSRQPRSPVVHQNWTRDNYAEFDLAHCV